MTKKFVVKPKSEDKREDKFVIMSLRIEKDLQNKFDELARKSDRSRNELMIMALKYALDNLEFVTKNDE